MNFSSFSQATVALIAMGTMGFFLTGCKDDKSAQGAGMVGPTVQVTKPVIKNVPVYKEWVGSLTGKVNATILPQVTGYLDAQVYQNGQVVKKGQELFHIDQRTFVAALNSAKAELERQKATLLEHQLDVERYTPLAKTNAVSQKQLDDAIIATKVSEAAVAAAQASVDSALLNLNFTVIKSPIDGIAGIATAQIGDLVSPNGGVLTEVSSVDPIRLDFAITEQDYLATIDREKKAHGGKVAMPESSKDIEVILSNGATYEYKARAVAVNRNVNTTTGTISVEAEVENPGFILRPGMFVRVKAVVQDLKDAIVLPTKSLVAMQGAYFVITVNDKNEPSICPVTPGLTVGEEQVVTPFFPGSLTKDSTVVVVGTMAAMQLAPRTPGEKAKGLVTPTPYVPVAPHPLQSPTTKKTPKGQDQPKTK